MLERAGLQFVGNEWIPSTSAARVNVENPTTGAVLASVCEGTTDDVDKAVQAADAAFAAWSSTPVAERVAVLRKVAAVLRRESDAIAAIISAEVGTTIAVSAAVQVGRPIEVLESLCDSALELAWDEQIGSTLIVRDPIGVAVAITPWNFPLHQAIAKVGAAIAAGCTVVLKPSELAPHSAYALADAFVEAGAPAGVFNVVTGVGSVIGDALVSHPRVGVISFTGSTAVGKHLASVAGQSIKRVALELGGKGPSVVLPGADIAATTAATVARCFTNSGQVCAALSRLIVHRDDLLKAENAAAEAAASFQLGDPLHAETTMGPVISAKQKSSIRAHITAAVRAGAKLVHGGNDVAVPEHGHFVAPTVFSDVTSDMAIAQQEVFGPVLVIIPYDTVEEAVTIANDSDYGLVGAVFGPDLVEAAHVAARIKVGMIGVNGGRINVKAPFGGFKESGLGREFGAYGIQEFVEIKSVNFTTPEAIVRL
ncbi:MULTISPECIES: aldehyde dehydrogenase family protein [Actinomycetes]|uniref:aldehyde dehydrogenase family protein n=1 Tax=Actinomycetes TaxID=1760 RepID=UPI0004BF2776|nr:MULTISPECIES: aldehyde dehydrogenase family protein [Actinomycetes]